MSNLINSIVSKNFVEADSIISETVELIMAQKLEEAKKMCAAKMDEQIPAFIAFMGAPGSNAVKLRRDVLEEDDIEEAMGTYRAGYKYDPVQKTTNAAGDTRWSQTATKGLDDKPDYAGKTKEVRDLDNTLSASGKQSSSLHDTIKSVTVRPDTNNGTGGDYNISTSRKSTQTSVQEEEKVHQLNALEKIKDAEVTRKVNKLTNVKNTLDSTDKALNVLGVKSNPTDSNKIQGQIDAIRKTRPYNEEKEEQLDEARIKIVKARIRGGKIQRRKKVSNVPGMTIRSGKLQRMSAAERRRRKLGARKAVRKRAPKMNRALMKRKRSLMKRKALGI